MSRPARRPVLRPRLRAALAASLAALALGATGAAGPREAVAAGPSVWARARDPGAVKRAAALAHAEADLEKAFRTAEHVPHEVRLLLLLDARQKLEDVGAATSNDVTLRLRLAQVLDLLDKHAEATAHFEWGVRSPRASAPARAEAWRRLAICYARLERYDDEIRAYGEALALEPEAFDRATLLANRAEAYMLRGDLTSAIDAYRAAIPLYTQMELTVASTTTLWGLAVALDRAGDLEGALSTLKLARQYDPSDRQINDRDRWFYVPAYDEPYYMALGHWGRAREAQLGAARAEHYGRAVSLWEEFLERAAPGDPWIPVARSRLRMCEKERDAALRTERAGGKRSQAGRRTASPVQVSGPAVPTVKRPPPPSKAP